MKKNTLLLVLLLLINGVILWKVWCTGCHHHGQDCAKTEHCEKHGDCKSDSTCTKGDHKECKKGDHHHCCGGTGENCCKGHGHHDAHHGHDLMYGPDHEAKMTGHLKNDLGFSDEQIAEFKTLHSEAGAKMKELQAQIKTLTEEQHEAIKGICTPEQLEKLEKMMSHHADHAGHDTTATE